MSTSNPIRVCTTLAHAKTAERASFAVCFPNPFGGRPFVNGHSLINNVYCSNNTHRKFSFSFFSLNTARLLQIITYSLRNHVANVNYTKIFRRQFNDIIIFLFPEPIYYYYFVRRQICSSIFKTFGF